MKNFNFRIYLRAIESEDFILTHNWRNDPVYINGVASLKRFSCLDTEKRWIESVIRKNETLNSIHLIICLKEDKSSIGMISLNNIDLINRVAAVGSLIGVKKHRGKGYLTEARKIIFDYGFSQIGLNRIQSKVLENNLASRKSVEKFGCTNEGTLRNAIYKNGKYNNLIMYSMLKSEFYEKYPH